MEVMMDIALREGTEMITKASESVDSFIILDLPLDKL